MYSVTTLNHHTNGRDDEGTKTTGGGNGLVKSPNRKPTPANPHVVNQTRPIQIKAPTLQPTIEVDEVPDVHVDAEASREMAMSPAAQAHALSLFLSSSTSDSGINIFCHLDRINHII